MSSKKVVILISGSGSNLQAFIDKQNRGELGGQVTTVISNKADAYGLVRAQNAGIEAIALEHTDFGSREAFDLALAEKIETLNPDLIILAGFMRILTSQFVERFKGKLLNIHPSLLPKYPGLHTHRRALENKDEFHGTSVHFVTEELDGGPIIAQSRLSLNSASNEQTVMQDVQRLEHQLYPEVASWFLNGRLVMEKEGVNFDGQKLRSPIIYGEDQS
ncbi:MAG: phosphoribosylglycinamide formyltransferase [Kangiellaceae bacterium]|nr:phosphoribosylglycinamide formyltransferase [Kangiellaceae bacterium]